MNKNLSDDFDDSIDLRTLFRLFLKRKWWFIGTMIIVLAAGLFYVFQKPVFYEARFMFKFNDDFVEDEYLQYKDVQDVYSRNKSVFINADKVPLLIETDLVMRALNDLDEIDDYTSSAYSYIVNLDLDDDSSDFVLKAKDEDKNLAKKIGLKLIESLGNVVMENDRKIFDNTLDLIKKDIKSLNDEIAGYADKIDTLNNEIKTDSVSLEKQGEILIYKEKILDNELEIKKLEDTSEQLSDKKSKVVNRVELLTKDPGYVVENDRTINSAIVFLLSIITGIVVVLAVNYIYKLKDNRKIKD
jgi:hypothetical protein